MLSIKSRMVDDLLKMYQTVFNMLRIDVYFLFDSYLYSNKITSNNITKLYRLPMFSFVVVDIL